jgi:hypothetical protein
VSTEEPLKSSPGNSIGTKVNGIEKMSIIDCGNASCRIDLCGGIVWKYVHFLSGVYSQWGSKEAREFAVNMLSNIHLMVPCQKCQNHALENAKTFKLREKLIKSAQSQRKPLDEGSMFRVTVDFHNMVNRMLHKPTKSVAEAYKSMSSCFVGNVCSLDDEKSCFMQGGANKIGEAEVKIIGLSCGLGALGVITIILLIKLLKENKTK